MFNLPWPFRGSKLGVSWKKRVLDTSLTQSHSATLYGPSKHLDGRARIQSLRGSVSVFFSIPIDLLIDLSLHLVNSP